MGTIGGVGAPDVQSDAIAKDRNGRIIGSVTCAGIDANVEQVRQGLAWAFKRYIPLGSPLRRRARGALAEQPGP
jgi:endonuclease YncB( thermonuclease family)